LIVAVILGPRVEAQGRRALQLSSGDVRGMFGGVDVATGQFQLSAVAVVVYLIILLVLLWPLVFRLVRKLLPPKAAKVVEEISHDVGAQVHDPETHSRREIL
jgi:putative tricarboxylic transport membrane protein